MLPIYIIKLNSNLTTLDNNMIKIKSQTFTRTTDDAGNIVVCEIYDFSRMPIFLVTENSHYIYSFFYAGIYWYARLISAYSDTYYPIKNKELSGTIYYIDI